MSELSPSRDWLWITSPDSKFARVVADACSLFGVTREELFSHRRLNGRAIARHYVSQRMADETDLTLPAIGRLFARRDHTTIANALKPHNRERVRAWLARNGGEAERVGA